MGALLKVEPKTVKEIEKKHKTGQTIVEFALILPAFLLILMGIIEFGRFIFYYSLVTSSAREAARYGAASGIGSNGKVRYDDCDGIRAAALRIADLAGVTASNISIDYDNGPSVDNISQNCPIGGTGPTLNLGDRIIITVNGRFTPVIPGIVHFILPSGKNYIPIISIAKRTIINNVAIQ